MRPTTPDRRSTRPPAYVNLGHGGQTLLSVATEEFVFDRLPLDAWLTGYGHLPAKGCGASGTDRRSCVRLVCETSSRRCARLDSISTYCIPAQLTSFVGRGEQIKRSAPAPWPPTDW